MVVNEHKVNMKMSGSTVDCLPSLPSFLPSERHCLHTCGMCDAIVINILISIFLYFFPSGAPLLKGFYLLL